MSTTSTDKTHLKPTELAVPAIEFRGVSKSFGSLEALHEVSFTIPQGQIVALLGANGAGKTTAISLMLGLRTPSQGQVQLLNRDPRDRRARSHCGVMLQDSGVPLTLTVRETILLFRSYYPHPLPFPQILEMTGLTKKANAPVGSLSGGQSQRLYFALAICGDPDILFLDEPTAGLDIEARHNFWNRIRSFVQQGKTILLTTHHLEEADALAERIIIIDHGHVRADASPSTLKAQFAYKRIRFDVNIPIHSEIFAQLPIYQLKLDDQHVSLLTTNLEATLRAILNQPVEIKNLEISGDGLEEVFLHLIEDYPQPKGA